MSDDTTDLIARLSPEKRALLLKALAERSRSALRSPPIQRRAAGARIPLSSAQRRLWVLERIDRGGVAYNELSVMRLYGNLDLLALRKSLDEIARRHEILRTTFPSVDGEPQPQVTPTAPVKVPLVDVAGSKSEDRETELRRLLEGEAALRFELQRGPLFRCTVFRLGQDHHVLSVCVHHIVFDGWSVSVFRRELAELYRAFHADQASPLAELAFQYGDFAAWEQRPCDDEARTVAGLKYWTRQLGTAPPLLNLSVAKPRPKVESFRGARRYFQVGTELSDALKRLSRAENVTLFMTLLSGFQVLLRRYADAMDLPIGTAVANRSQRELEGLIGFFVDTIVLRGDLAGNPSVRELLHRTREVALAAHEHQHVAFDDVVDALKPPRSLAWNPIFQIMFNLQSAPRVEIELPDLVLEEVLFRGDAAKFDLTLSFEQTAAGLRAEWHYNTDLFEHAAIERMNGHLETIYRAMALAPDTRIEALPWLTSDEERQLNEWCGDRRGAPTEKPVHQSFAERATRSPNDLAIVQGDRIVTHGELNRLADEIAERLLTLRSDPGSRVGIHMHRSVHAIAALLGVLKAGHAYVPLDPDHPQERLKRLIADAGISAILTERDVLATLPDVGVEASCVDELEPSEAQHHRAHPTVDAEHVAYVMYTSGSSGEPKGVIVTHGNLAYSTAARTKYYHEPVDRFLLLSPLTSDSSVAGLFWALTQGGTLVLPSSARLDPRTVCELVRERRVTHLLCIPGLYSALLGEARTGELASLRVVIVAGEPCPASVVEEHLRQASQAILFNEYGPTECTVWCTAHRCDQAVAGPHVPIGRPIAGAEVLVLDGQHKPVPIGVRGELHVGGPGVARGYLNDSNLTSERFFEWRGSRIYKTGDLARRLGDGTLEFLGRTDLQVKLNGFRVELEEVSAELQRHPEVVDAIAQVWKDDDGAPQLVAYACLEGRSASTARMLCDFLATKLPAYAVPSAVEILETMPRLANGKVDRAKLPRPRAEPLPSRPLDGWSDLERSIAAIWATTLKRDVLDRDANFFENGGDSLSMIRVFNRVRGLTDRNLSITDLFNNPTIRALARLMLPGGDAGES